VLEILTYVFVRIGFCGPQLPTESLAAGHPRYASQQPVKLTMDEPETKKISALTASDWSSPIHVHALVLMAVTGVGIYFCYRLVAPFFPALAWALALAVLFAPLHRWLESKVIRPNLAATISVLLVALIVVVPATFVAERIIGEAAEGAETIKTIVVSGEWRRAFEAHPSIAPVGRWIEQQFDLPELVQTAASWLTSTAASFVQGSILQLIGIVLTFYMLFYFLRDRGVALKSLRSLSPLSKADMNRLFSDVFDTVHATVYGTFAVAIVQGALGGLMFWWLGLPEPLLWGLVMGLLAVVPVLGAFVIWIPAAIFLALDGSAGKALLLTIWGAIVVGGIDNLLYPILVGRRLKMHSVIAFVAIVGGLIVLGPSGLILGPVIFTVTRVLLEIWSKRNAAADT
jgi:predicted PurR-regulated permease PerM